nr:MAG TPA: hypothetical protein [Caudoviricetes sp.]
MGRSPGADDGRPERKSNVYYKDKKRKQVIYFRTNYKQCKGTGARRRSSVLCLDGLQDRNSVHAAGLACVVYYGGMQGDFVCI